MNTSSAVGSSPIYTPLRVALADTPAAPLSSPIEQQDIFTPSRPIAQSLELFRQWQSAQPTAAEIHHQATIASQQPVVYAQGWKNPDATVAVIDSFSRCQHGESVVSVLLKNGNVSDNAIQRIDDGILCSPDRYYLFAQPGPDSGSDRLKAGLELSAVESLRRTSQVLEEIANDPDSKIKTINQSQATSRYTIFSDATSLILEKSPDGPNPRLTQKGLNLFRSLDVAPYYSPEAMLAVETKIAAKIEEMMEQSPLVQKELTRHCAVSKRLEERGVNYVIAAGNYRGTLSDLLESGVIGEKFDDNLYANPYNITVGAIDTKQTATRSDDTLASFSSICPETDFLANGVDVLADGYNIVSGTSFSAPLVAGRLADLRRQNPHATAKELQTLLRQTSSTIADSDVPVIY